MSTIQRDPPPHQSFPDAASTSSPNEDARAELAKVKAEWARSVERTTLEKDGLHTIIERLKTENEKLVRHAEIGKEGEGRGNARGREEQLRERLIETEKHYRGEVQRLQQTITQLSKSKSSPVKGSTTSSSSPDIPTAIIERDAALRDLTALRKEIERLEREKEEMQLFVGIAEQQVETWTGERAALEAQMAAERASLQSELKTEKDARERMEREVQGMREARVKVEEVFVKRGRDRDAAQRERNEMQRERDEARGQVEVLREDLGSLQTTVDEARKERDGARGQVSKLEAEVEQLRSTITNSERRIKDADRLSAEHQSTKRNLSIARAAQTTAQQQCATLRADNKRLVSSNTELQRRFDAEKDRVETVQKASAELQRKFEAERGKVETLQRASEKGLKEFDKAMADVKAAARREEARLKGDVERLRDSKVDLERRAVDATRQVGKVKAQLDTLTTFTTAEIQTLKSEKETLAKDLDKSLRTNRDMRDALQRNKNQEQKRLSDIQTADALSQWMSQELRRKCQALEDAEKQLGEVKGEADGLRTKQVELEREDAEKVALQTELDALRTRTAEAEKTMEKKLQAAMKELETLRAKSDVAKEDPEKAALRRDLQCLKTSASDAEKTMDRKLQAAKKEIETLKAANAIAKQQTKRLKDLKEQFDACQADRVRKKGQIAEMQARLDALEGKSGEVRVKEEAMVDGMVPLSARSEVPPTPTVKCQSASPSTIIVRGCASNEKADQWKQQSTYRPSYSPTNALSISVSRTETPREHSLRYASPMSPPNSMSGRVLDFQHPKQLASPGHLSPVSSSNAIPLGSPRVLSADVRPVVHPSKPLTAEIYGRIAGFLAGDNAYRSLSNLNLVDRAVHLTTLPVLWETVTWDNNAVDYGTYGIAEPCSPNRTLPVGWSFTRHLFYSDQHRDRLQYLIAQCPTWKAQSRHINSQPVDAAFPQLRVVLAWHMEHVDRRDVAYTVTHVRRHSQLQLRGTMACATFHRLLSSIRVRYWLGGPCGSLQMGAVTGITDIRILGSARLTGTRPHNPAHRFFNLADRRMWIASELAESDEGLHTMQEVLRLVERPNPEISTWGDMRPVELQLWDIRPLFFRGVIDTLGKILPAAPQDLRLNVQLAHPKSNLTVEMIRQEFRYVVEMYTRFWPDISTSRRSGPQDNQVAPSFFRFQATSAGKINFEGTIVSTPGSLGKTFTADLKAWKDGTVICMSGSPYPEAFPKGLY